MVALSQTHRLRLLAAVVLIVNLFVARGHAQESQSLEARIRQAESLLNDESWDDAYTLLRTLLTEAPDNGDIWRRLGYAYEGMEEIEKAKEAYRRAAELPEDRDMAHYSLARLYALEGKIELAVAEIRLSREAGFGDLEMLRSDPAFESLRSDPRFESAAAFYPEADWINLDAVVMNTPTLTPFTATYHIMVAEGPMRPEYQQVRSLTPAQPLDDAALRLYITTELAGRTGEALILLDASAMRGVSSILAWPRFPGQVKVAHYSDERVRLATIERGEVVDADQQTISGAPFVELAQMYPVALSGLKVGDSFKFAYYSPYLRMMIEAMAWVEGHEDMNIESGETRQVWRVRVLDDHGRESFHLLDDEAPYWLGQTLRGDRSWSLKSWSPARTDG